MKKKRLLVVGWGTWASDYAFDVASQKNIDLYLATSTYIPEWMHKYVTPDHMVITNTYDSERLLIDVLSYMYAQHIFFDAVLTFFEMNIVQAADLAYALGCTFLSPRAARKSSGNKLFMRMSCAHQNIPTPRFTVFKTVSEGLHALKMIGAPAILKPVKSGHSIGTIYIPRYDEHEFFRAFYEARRQLDSNIDEWMQYYGEYKNTFLLEEYVPGPVLSVDGLVQNHNVMICGNTQFIMSDLPLFHQLGAYIPGQIDDKIQNECYEYARRIIRALEFNNCAFHCEIRLSNQGPRLLEIAARPPGGRMTLGYKYAYGVDVMSLYIDICLGKKINYDFKKNKEFVYHHSVFSDAWGEVNSIEGIDKLKRKKYFTLFFTAHIGDIKLPMSGFPDSLCYYQVRADSIKQLDRHKREAQRLLQYKYKRTPGVALLRLQQYFINWVFYVYYYAKTYIVGRRKRAERKNTF